MKQARHHAKAVVILLITCTTLAGSAIAQNALSEQLCKDKFKLPGLDNIVTHMYPSENGLYAAGHFNNAGTAETRCIARWDGARWRAAGRDITVWYDRTYGDAHPTWGKQVYYCNGDLYVTLYRSQNYIYRLTAQGTWEELFAGTILGCDENGVLYIESWGDLSIYDGTEKTGLSCPYYMDASCMAVSEGITYFAGSGDFAGSISLVAAWDGTSWTRIDGDINGRVNTIAVNSSSIYIGGSFSSAGGVSINNIAKWNGSAWSALGSGLDDEVLCLCIDDGTVFAGGSFNSSGQTQVNHVARWDGTQWHGLQGGTNEKIRTLCSMNGMVYAGGDFTSAGGKAAVYAAVWNGAEWSSMGTGKGLSGIGYGLVYTGDKLYVCGNFTTAGSKVVNNIAVWDGTEWAALGDGFNSYVKSVAIDNSTVYACGNFTASGQAQMNHVARWDGTQWHPMGRGFDEKIEQIVADNGRVFVFSSYAPESPSSNWMYTWDGTQWQPLAHGLDGYPHVNCMALTDTALVAAGRFEKNGTTYGLISYDFTDISIIPVSSLPFYYDFNIYDGTCYGTTGQQTDTYTTDELPLLYSCRPGIDQSWIPAPGTFSGFEYWDDGYCKSRKPEPMCLLCDDNAVYIGGDFYNILDNTIQDLVAWDGQNYITLTSVERDMGFSQNYGIIFDIEQAGNSIYFTGNFSHANGNPSFGIGIVPKPDFSAPPPQSILSLSEIPGTEQSSSMGTAWADFNNDGYQDLFVANDNNQANFLYTGNGDGTFTPVTQGPVVSEQASSYSGSWADIDNDGDEDLFVANYGAVNSLFINSGDGTFTPAANSPVTQDAANSSCGAWCDYDSDGWIDLLVTNNGQANELFHNNGDGTFSPVTDTDITSGENASMCAVWSDILESNESSDFSRLPDLYICNKQAQHNRLFVNNGNGSFTEQTFHEYVQDTTNSWSCSIADIDNDNTFGMELLVVNNGGTAALFQQHKWEVFKKRTDLGGLVTEAGPGRSAAFADVDGDMDIDVFVSRRNEPCVLYKNMYGTFSPRYQAATNARGVSWCDINGNGAPDLVVACDGYANQIYTNTADIENWLNFRLDCTVSNRSGIGTVVYVYTGSACQARQVSSVTGFGSQNGSQLLFGLGDNTQADSVKAVFPSGLDTVITNIQSNQTVTIHEPASPASGIDRTIVPAEFSLSHNYPNPFNPETMIQFSLPAPQKVTLEVYSIEGRNIQTLIDRRMQAGMHTVTFSGEDLPSGVYLYRIDTQGFSAVRRMLLIK